VPIEKSEMDPKRFVAASYDRIAERYLNWRAEQHAEGVRVWLSLLREYVSAGSDVLDLGCGAGVPLTRMLAKHFSTTGVDISARQIELARGNVPNGRFIHGDVCNVDFPPATFDAVVASYSFIHIPRAEHYPVFCKIVRWLRPAGVVLADFSIADREFNYADDWLGVPMFWSSFDADGERAVLESAGFKLLIDRIDTEIEDGRPHSLLLVVAKPKSVLQAE